VRKVVFISGGITNVPDYIERFEQAEKEIRGLGLVPFNPAIMTKPLVDAGVDFPDEAWLEIDFTAIKQCDGIYHLTNWENSRGSNKEHQIALAYNKVILYQKELNFYKALGKNFIILFHAGEVL
jgi:hypothetical protein